MICHIILNFSGISPRITLTFCATGLYFFLVLRLLCLRVSSLFLLTIVALFSVVVVSSDKGKSQFNPSVLLQGRASTKKSNCGKSCEWIKNGKVKVDFCDVVRERSVGCSMIDDEVD